MQTTAQPKETIHPGHLQALNAFWSGVTPDPYLNVDEWADRYRFLSEKESPEPGQWRTSRTPYAREPMRCLSPAHPAREVVLMWGAQLAKTETGNNFVGHNIDAAPGPMLIVQPTVEIAKRFSRQRLSSMIQSTPRLKEKVSEAKSRDAGNTTLSKDYEGGIVIVTGANSAAGLRSMPIRQLMLDEVDAYPEDCDGEGEPCELAIARTRNFARKKILITSTPTFEGRSRIAEKFKEGTQCFYHVPCPHCGKKQILKWQNIKWQGNDHRTAQYMCDGCAVLIDEHHKTFMLENGEWIASNPAATGEVMSFHLSSLYSPVGWFSWSDIVRQWLNAQGNPNKLRTFVNTVLAETWKEKDGAPEWKKLYDRREAYKPNTIPDARVLFLTAGVDVQADRLEIEIVGWDRLKRSWSIDHRQIYGDPEDKTPAGPWAELDKILAESWIHPDGVALSIVRIAIDEGYKTQKVREYVRSKASPRVMSVRGSDTSQILLGHPKIVDVNADGKKIERGLKMWPVGVSIGKSELYGWLNLERPTAESGAEHPAGYCFFPEYGEEYFRQLTAEQIVVRVVRGYRRYMWEKTRERNEALDLRLYARAAAAAYGMDRFMPERWDELAEAVAKTKKTVQNVPGEEPKVVRGGIARRPGKFLNRNRNEDR